MPTWKILQFYSENNWSTIAQVTAHSAQDAIDHARNLLKIPVEIVLQAESVQISIEQY